MTLCKDDPIVDARAARKLVDLLRNMLECGELHCDRDTKAEIATLCDKALGLEDAA